MKYGRSLGCLSVRLVACLSSPHVYRDLRSLLFIWITSFACMYVARLRWHAALTLYASGQTTGVVVEIHSRGVAVSAVYEGYLLPYTVQTSDIGGEMIGRCLVPAVERTVGCVFANPIEKMECISDLVKAMAVVPLKKSSSGSSSSSKSGGDDGDGDADASVRQQQLPPENCYQLRRGRNGDRVRVRVTAAERLACGEALFDPGSTVNDAADDDGHGHPDDQDDDDPQRNGGLADTLFRSLMAGDTDW